MSPKCFVKATFTNLKGPLSKTFKILMVEFRAVNVAFCEQAEATTEKRPGVEKGNGPFFRVIKCTGITFCFDRHIITIIF